MEHLTPYQLFQLERYGDILPEYPRWIGYQPTKQEEFTEWVERGAEKQLDDMERGYGMGAE